MWGISQSLTRLWCPILQPVKTICKSGTGDGTYLNKLITIVCEHGLISNLCNSLITAIFAWRLANFKPGQIRGPWSKGRKLKGCRFLASSGENLKNMKKNNNYFSMLLNLSFVFKMYRNTETKTMCILYFIQGNVVVWSYGSWMWVHFPFMSRCTRYNIMKGRRFFPGTPDSFTNKTDRHDLTTILLKVAL